MMNKENVRIRVLDIALAGILSAILYLSQVVLAALPNIELVSFFVILFALHFGRKTIAVIYIFVLLEGLTFGFTDWWLTYLYIWTLLYLIARLLRFCESVWAWSIISAMFGLLFGVLGSLPIFFTRGFYGGVAVIISGIPFDLLHCAGNFVVMLALYHPFNKLLPRLKQSNSKTG